MKLPAPRSHPVISPRFVWKGQERRLQVQFRGSMTKRQRELVWELFAPYYAEAYKLLFDGTSETIAKWKENYEKALYGKIRGSAKKRGAFEFLRMWHMASIVHKESGTVMTDAEQLDLLAPLLEALCERDPQFFKGLAEAMQILEARIASNAKGRNIGSGDLHLEKCLLEYALKTGLVAGALPPHTVRELNEQFVSKFRRISDKKLREKCKSLGIPLKPDARGRAAVRYSRRKCPRVEYEKGLI